MKRSLDTVIFDLDDTLHDDSSAFSGAAERVARDVARVHAHVDPIVLRDTYVAEAMKFWISLTNEHLSISVRDSRERMWLAALQQCGLDDRALALTCSDAYPKYRNELLQPFPGALVLLRSLRDRGIKIGLISNGFSETHREKIVLLKLDSYFDAVFLADEVGMVKPDPRLFLHACEVLGSTPEHSAMVGDRYDRDVRGGHAAGLYTVFMNVHDFTIPAGAPQPDATVFSIEEVEAVLPLAAVV